MDTGVHDLMIQEGWAENHGIRLHYLEGNAESALPLVAIVFVPGFLGSAEDYITEMSALAPRRCIAVSLRGRGLSDSPNIGYSFDDHISDIEAIMRETGLNNFCLMAYSTSVAYAIGYASGHPELVAGLIIGDYPARYPAIPSEWIDRTLSFFPKRAEPPVIRALQLESTEVPLWDSLSRIKCPALILRGGQQGSRLTEEDAKKYQERLSEAKVVALNCGHDLWKDYDCYVNEIRAFLDEIDSGI